MQLVGTVGTAEQRRKKWYSEEDISEEKATCEEKKIPIQLMRRICK